MVDTIQKKKKGPSRQTMLLIAFAVVVLGGGGYYYYTRFAPHGGESVVELGTKRQLQIKSVDWKRAVYEHAFLKRLKNPLPTPLEVGAKGNKQPFSAPVLLTE